MNKNLFVWVSVIIVGIIFVNVQFFGSAQKDTKPYKRENISQMRLDIDEEGEPDCDSIDCSTYSEGYKWAEDNNINKNYLCNGDTSSFDEGCEDYIKGVSLYNNVTDSGYVEDSYGDYRKVEDDNCTVDCSGHEAGYKWAEDNYIDDENDCGGNSNSFIEGCEEYVYDNY
ncbi:MAG: hypothetical protein HC932_00060 [Thermales bacterium]|nr:hypothetical protein [Thermales bacterium]